VQIAKYLRHHLEDVLLKYGVDVVMSGHIHAYSRSCPVADNRCRDPADGAIMHVITGSGGRLLSSVRRRQKEWVAHAEKTWGFSRFTVRLRCGRTAGRSVWRSACTTACMSRQGV
jgi:acid phosphatase type 7